MKVLKCLNLDLKHLDHLILSSLSSLSTNRRAAFVLTPSRWLDCLVISEAQGQEEGLSALEHDV